MPTTKLTKRAVERLAAPDPSGNQALYWDEDLKGFGVLVSGTTVAKTYVVQHKLPGGTTRRVTVGPINVLDLEDKKDEATGEVIKKGARSLAKEVIAEFYSGKDPKAEKREAARRGRTLRVALEAYLAGNKQLAASSAKGYRRSVERYLKLWLDKPLREITREMVEERHEAIAEETKRPGRSGGGENTGEATANSAMRALRAIWNHAADKDSTLPGNPVRLGKRWFDVAPRERCLSGDELPVFYAALDKVENQTQADYIRFVMFTGLRRASAAALRWEQVDFAAKVIRLPRRQLKGGKRGLDLPMTDYVRDLLVARRALGNDGGWVFGADSKSGHIEEPRFAFEEVGEACGIAVSAHDLRRTYQTHAEETDISVMALKALVNHAIGGDVTENYVRMTVERLREPAQRVADRLKKLCGIDATLGGNNVEKMGSR